LADKAFQEALRILGRRDYFRLELAERLRSKGFAEEEVIRALDRCGELGLLDDRRNARRFAELRAVSKGWGPRRIEAELVRRGVGSELAREVAALDHDLEAEALTMAMRRLERRAAPRWWRLHDRRGRMLSSLIGRGFDPDTALEAVREAATRRENEDDASDDEL
jgi:regulatory protein